MNIDNNIFFHCYNIYTLLCASTSCLISHDARIIPSSTERSCITIEHSYYKNNSDHLLIFPLLYNKPRARSLLYSIYVRASCA